METYEAIPRRVEAVQWDGMNHHEVLGFLGPEHALMAVGGYTVHLSEARVLVKSDTGGAWVELQPGWWVSRTVEPDPETGKHAVSVFTEGAFKNHWRMVLDP